MDYNASVPGKVSELLQTIKRVKFSTFSLFNFSLISRFSSQAFSHAYKLGNTMCTDISLALRAIPVSNVQRAMENLAFWVRLFFRECHIEGALSCSLQGRRAISSVFSTFDLWLSAAVCCKPCRLVCRSVDTTQNGIGRPCYTNTVANPKTRAKVIIQKIYCNILRCTPGTSFA